MLGIVFERTSSTQGWRQTFSDRGAGASDRGGIKRLKNGVSMRYFAKVPPTRTKIPPAGG